MKVTMVEVNKQASNALPDDYINRRNKALQHLMRLQPTQVSEPIAEVIAKGRY